MKMIALLFVKLSLANAAYCEESESPSDSTEFALIPQSKLIEAEHKIFTDIGLKDKIAGTDALISNSKTLEFPSINDVRNLTLNYYYINPFPVDLLKKITDSNLLLLQALKQPLPQILLSYKDKIRANSDINESELIIYYRASEMQIIRKEWISSTQK